MVDRFKINKEYLYEVDCKEIDRDMIEETKLYIQLEQLRALEVISAQLEEIYMSMPEGK